MNHLIADDFSTFVLKSAQGTSQQLKKRQKYEVQPRFIKAGLHYQSKYANARQQGIAQRISVCEILKSKGTKNFTKGLLEEATREYEQALSIFRYIEDKNPRWRQEGIKDDDLIYKDEGGSSPLEKEQIQALKLSLYLNIAICTLKLEDCKTCLAACQEALKIDPKNTKALYRAAKALTYKESAGQEDYLKAQEFLKKACELEPDSLEIQKELAKVTKKLQKPGSGNEAELFQGMLASKKDDSTVNKNKSAQSQNGSAKVENAQTKEPEQKSTLNQPQQQTQTIKAEGQEERSKYIDKYEEAVKNKNLDNDKNEVWKLLNEGKNFDSYDYPLSYEVDPNAPVPEEIKELGRVIETRGSEMLRLYEMTGQTQEAATLRQQLLSALAAKKQLEKIAALDFNKPTDHLKNVAAKLK